MTHYNLHCTVGFLLLQNETCFQVFGEAATLEVTVVVPEEKEGVVNGGCEP